MSAASLGALAAVVSLWTVTGLGITSLCGVRFRSRVGAWAFALLAGLAAFALAATAIRVAGGARDWLVACGLASLSLAWWLWRRPAIVEGPRTDRATRIVLALVAALVAVLILDALASPDSSHDALVIWVEKARTFALVDGFPPSSETFELGARHWEYPPLVPLAQALLFELCGVDLVAVRVLHVVFAAALLGVFFEAAGAHRPAALGTLALALCPWMLRRAANGYADILLAAETLAAFAALRRALIGGRTGALVFAALLLAAAAVTKNEGTVFLGIALSLAVAFTWPRPRRCAIAFLAAVPALAWLAFARTRGWEHPDFALLPRVVEHPALLLERAAAIARFAAEQAVDPGGSFLVAIAAVVVLAIRPPWRGPAGWLAVAGALAIAAVLVSFLFSTFPVAVHLANSYGRVWISGMALLWAAAVSSGEGENQAFVAFRQPRG